MHPESTLEAFEKEKIVFLTADSDEALNSIEEDKVYVVGGISDNNNSLKVEYNILSFRN